MSKYHDDDDDRRRDDSETEKRDASAGWKREYELQRVDPELRSDDGERPADCACWDATLAIPCFPCSRAGFETQNPDEPAAADETADESASETPRETTATTDGGTSAPVTGALADSLGVRTDLLLRFVNTHPDPTAAVILGWAFETGDLEATPDELQQETRQWLEAHDRGDDDDDRLRADGGAYRLPEAGSHVFDREADEYNEVIVLEQYPETTAEQHTTPRSAATVAQRNPSYDAAAPVVEGVYLESVKITVENWDDRDELRDAANSPDCELKRWAFPAGRVVCPGVGK